MTHTIRAEDVERDVESFKRNVDRELANRFRVLASALEKNSLKELRAMYRGDYVVLVNRIETFRSDKLDLAVNTYNATT